MSYYQHHVFFCTNLRDGERQSCDQCGAQKARDYVKQRCKELGLSGEGKVRINNAGCLDRCEQGPVAVVYPDEVWYSFETEADIDAEVERMKKKP